VSVSKPCIILVPGLYGSEFIEEATGKRRFHSLTEALFGRTSLSAKGDLLEIPGTRQLVAGGLLNDVPIIPGIFSIDVYGSSLAFLKSEFEPRSQVMEFAYDWRADIHEAVCRLAAVIKELKNRGSGPIALVGHSLGGMIISYYLRYGEQAIHNAVESWEGAGAVRSAVLSAVPFRGAALAFRVLQTGSRMGISRLPLSAESLGSMSSIFQLMPEPEFQTVLAPGGQSGPSIYDPIAWETGKWGYFQCDRAISERALENRRELLGQNLQLAKKMFALQLSAPKVSGQGQQRMLVISGKGYPTQTRAVWLGLQKGSPRWSFTGSSLFEDGDSQVPLASGAPPDALKKRFSVTHLILNTKHSRMLSRPPVQKEIADFLHAGGF
jgi:pimeloyl-ACP methyl ester carboxylesterase